MLISVHPIHATLIAPYVPVQWTQVENSSFGTSNINAITFNGSGQYLAAGGQGKIATSPDAVNWTQRDSGLGNFDLFAAAYGDGRYIIGGSSGRMATSFDGVSWSVVASSFGSNSILSITYFASQNIWIAVGGNGRIATSSDGTTWVQITSPFGSFFINKIYSVGGLSILVGTSALLATSTDGSNWVVRTSSFSTSTINSVSSNPLVPYRYVAVGNDGKIAYSDNGTSWTQILPSASFGSSTIRAVAGNEETFAAAGALGRLATSFDRQGWTQRTSTFGSTTINDIYLREQFGVAVGNSGKIAYST